VIIRQPTALASLRVAAVAILLGVCRSHVSTRRMFHSWFLYSAGEEQPPGHSHVPHGRDHWAALAPTARRMPFCSPCLLPSLHFPLDLVSDLFPAQAVAQEHGRNGRAQGLEVLVGVPAVDLKLVRQPLRRGCEELGHAGEGIVR
jgi:hypothetical protein